MLGLIGIALSLSAKGMEPQLGVKWDNPFQNSHIVSSTKGAVPLQQKDCDRAAYNDCTFRASVDFDGDGRLDRAYMANVGSVGIIAVSFANPRKKPMVVASFRGRLNGSSYIKVDRRDKRTIIFVQPEASMAEIRMISGKPRIRWIGD